MTMTTATPEIPIARRTRSDGERSRQRILEAAAQLATVQGLDRLSIGELAAHIGMSKSGLYAHFRSKEELQLATIDAAEAIFDEVVVAPMYDGRARHPGRAGPRRRLPRSPRAAGSSRAAASSPARRPSSSPGRARSRSGSRPSTVAGAATSRTTSGSRRPRATWPRARTSTRSCFELDAYLLYAHAAFAFRGDPAVLDRASDAVRRRLGVRSVPPDLSSPSGRGSR